MGVEESADRPIAGKIIGKVVLGLYAIASELACLLGNKISTVVNMLCWPLMAELPTNLDGADGYYRMLACGAVRHGLAETLTTTVPVYVEWT